jgi:glycosyltransferase involved in cell wall biosynthesis
MPREPIRVLLAENTVRGLGGSYESLYVTATSLDRSRFQPIVLFFQPNHFAEKLEADGIRVLVATSRQFWEKPSYLEKSARIRSSLPRKGALGAVRRNLVALARAVVGGLPMTWTVHRILRREKIAILHTNNNLERDSMMILAGVLAGVPVVAHERQLATCSTLARRLSRRVRTLVCISNAVLEHTRTNGTLTADRRRIYNAVNLAECRSIHPSLPPNGNPRVGIVGRIMPKKGQRFFVEAAAKVRAEFPSAEFYIIGQATGNDRDYEVEVRDLAEKLGLGGSLRWTGFLEKPLPLVAALDVVVHAAIEPEPFGRVIIEALALGRPVVATALGGPIEILENGVSGLLVPPGQSGELAEQITRLLRDKELSSRISAGARRRAEDFGVGTYIGQIEKAYEDALERPSNSVGTAHQETEVPIRR